MFAIVLFTELACVYRRRKFLIFDRIFGLFSAEKFINVFVSVIEIAVSLISFVLSKI